MKLSNIILSVTLMVFLSSYTINIFKRGNTYLKNQVVNAANYTKIDLIDFESISVSGAVNVSIVESDTLEVWVKNSSEDRSNNMQLNVEAHRLSIRYEAKEKEDPIKIHIKIPRLRLVESSMKAIVDLKNINTDTLFVNAEHSQIRLENTTADYIKINANNKSRYSINKSQVEELSFFLTDASSIHFYESMVDKTEGELTVNSNFHSRSTFKQINLRADESSRIWQNRLSKK